MTFSLALLLIIAAPQLPQQPPGDVEAVTCPGVHPAMLVSAALTGTALGGIAGGMVSHGDNAGAAAAVVAVGGLGSLGIALLTTGKCIPDWAPLLLPAGFVVGEALGGLASAAEGSNGGHIDLPPLLLVTGAAGGIGGLILAGAGTDGPAAASGMFLGALLPFNFFWALDRDPDGRVAALLLGPVPGLIISLSAQHRLGWSGVRWQVVDLIAAGGAAAGFAVGLSRIPQNTQSARPDWPMPAGAFVGGTLGLVLGIVLTHHFDPISVSPPLAVVPTRGGLALAGSF